ncbi:protein transport protein bet1 [Coemansia nantahalensis]|uniref:Protein transport protein bet1 n=1 Tax=Coemansia nantahalensis TaxID=2789366 RepID=A0ACC1JX29_9FUNG|nr:protein transport protein bet1 [Coemansia nantahalensis]KAJ2768868.1 protein transport protein bet1 [Coemansia nantahalensis]
MENRQRNQAGGRGGPAGLYDAYGGDAAVEEDPNSKDVRLKSKVAMLREVSISIGDEIRDQNQFLATMGQDMEGLGGRLGATMKRFYAMWARQGCGPLLYLLLFTICVFVFLYLYLKSR